MLYAMRDTLIVIAVVGACLAMLWISYRIEPSWSSADGTRFMCVGQELPSDHHVVPGRAREIRGEIRPEGTLLLTRRVGLRRDVAGYRLIGSVAESPPNKRQFLVAPVVAAPDRHEVILRMAARNRAVAVLDRLLQRPQSQP